MRLQGYVLGVVCGLAQAALTTVGVAQVRTDVRVVDEGGVALELVTVVYDSLDEVGVAYRVASATDLAGRVSLPGAAVLPDTAAVTFSLVGFRQNGQTAGRLRRAPTVVLAPDAMLEEVTIAGRGRGDASNGRLRDVEASAIYAGRKTDLILPTKLLGNLATNNAREVYKSVAGLSVWESDAGGLQLSIGARGLDPNRSSSFNTRQNGFDISADALGYPESYYVPPVQALQRIELVRGAASLQYGTQFGGLLNFKLQEGPADRKLQVVSEQTAGSFGLFNTFNSVGGTVGRANYYAFGQYKRGDGWRDNSGFEQATGYLDVHYAVNERLVLGLELTRMAYTAQQPGGLLDFEFEADARQSRRGRNFFQVDWGLAALHLDYDVAERTHLNVRTFVLDARRRALGELGPINRPDPLRERDLIDGQYRNLGQEARLTHRYRLGRQESTALVGYRYYRGFTNNRQGLGPDGDAPDFRFLHPDSLEGSAFDFPSRNYAVFAENLIRLGERWSLTPGLRYEFIRTAAEGYFRRTVRAGREVLLDELVPDAQTNTRAFLLGGLGLSYRRPDGTELYANVSQNYRAINFSDLVVRNPNLLIDSTLADERGYNAELGVRGQDEAGAWRFDVSGFLLRYANRIGIREIVVPDAVTVERQVSLRTNIGAATLIGVEAYGEMDLVQVLRPRPDAAWSVRPFLNASLIRGRYTSGGSDVVGRAVESVAPLTLKSGVTVRRGAWRAQALYTQVNEHFSDATNAVRVADATRGLIPTYRVVDATLGYERGRFRYQLGVNNLLNARYFTRRASGYPGPGIIPAEARGFWGGVRLVW